MTDPSEKSDLHTPRQFRIGNKLLPFISEQKYNLAIKRIFKAAGLKRLVTVINPTTREEEKRVLYEIASSHLARRTFVGNLYRQVKDPNLVGALSGHKEGSKAFMFAPTVSRPEELPPRMVQHRFALSLDATRNFWLFMSMFIVIAVQSVGLYLDWRPDRGRYDNDLKYRYVLMKGEASPKRLSELEELFEVERDQRRIDSMQRDVEKYERLVRRRAALDEQARLKAQEAEQLKRDAARLKNK